MSLVLHIALIHIRFRVRQTLVAVAGVATGVGFSIMMAALMEGSQAENMRYLIDNMPHVSITDDRRQATVQPAETAFDVAEIHGLTPQPRRRGIKNPMAIIASLEDWVPGTVAPSISTQGIIRYAARDVGASITGIDPHREPKASMLVKYMREGTLNSLYRGANGIILGDLLAKRIGARVGSTITVQGGNGARISAQVVGLFHSGNLNLDYSAAYVLMKTAQVLARQTGLVTDLKVRLADFKMAWEVALRIERETGYKSVSWQEASESFRNNMMIVNALMYTIVGAILLVASFGTYNIVSTIIHEKVRDIAIMKSLGLRAATVKRLFVIESVAIGFMGSVAGWVLGLALTVAVGSIKFQGQMTDPVGLPLEYSVMHYAIATAVALAASIVAGYFPARKASRLHPVEIIRGAT
jgi:lipoprotein-releasing system permease protein